ncbi:PEP-CTERM protein-sorting domain-containing protein [Nitrosomonas aestuarii]|uniref:PEP-CTERM protein-sorting domain-containing protein n=1 Tax=Nitrosomonas aestuarii TaxID=52441 RepID=A0A1I3YBJ7_9PROT|nr:PEP-CTERM sorting domain-containing protein [Nitrosomonas aestuarii]SFK29110.1 PEP-CTERM protein-sorting domain-containing protein [Nitrosomonas aestuarii]
MSIRQIMFTMLLLPAFNITNAVAAPVYLNNTNISVAVGAGTSPGSFNNTFNGGNTIDKVIDAPSATATEFHDQNTHIWFTATNVGGGLELQFDFGQEFDLRTLHFWNYTSEGYDVDNINFTFFNSSNTQVGTLGIVPALGSSPGILAQDIPLAAPLNVQFVTAFLTGTNREVDFQNIGFTAEVSTPRPTPNPNQVPEPGIISLLAIGLFGTLIGRHRFL